MKRLTFYGPENPFASDAEDVLPPGLKEQFEEQVQIKTLLPDPSLLPELTCYIKLLLISENMWIDRNEIQAILKPFGPDIRGALHYMKASTRPFSMSSRLSSEPIDLEAHSRNLCLLEIKNILAYHEMEIDREKVWKDLADKSSKKEIKEQLEDITKMANWFDVNSRFAFHYDTYVTVVFLKVLKLKIKLGVMIVYGPGPLSGR